MLLQRRCQLYVVWNERIQEPGGIKVALQVLEGTRKLQIMEVLNSVLCDVQPQAIDIEI